MALVSVVALDVEVSLGCSLFLISPSALCTGCADTVLPSHRISNTKTVVFPARLWNSPWKALQRPLLWCYSLEKMGIPICSAWGAFSAGQLKRMAQNVLGAGPRSSRILPRPSCSRVRTYGPSRFALPHPRTLKADLFFPRAESHLSICLHLILLNLASGCAFCFPWIKEIK